MFPMSATYALTFFYQSSTCFNFALHLNELHDTEVSVHEVQVVQPRRYQLNLFVSLQVSSSEVLKRNFQYCASSMFHASVEVQGVPVRKRRSSRGVISPPHRRRRSRSEGSVGLLSKTVPDMGSEISPPPFSSNNTCSSLEASEDIKTTPAVMSVRPQYILFFTLARPLQ